MAIQFDSLSAEQFNVFQVSQIAPNTFVAGIAGLDFVVIPRNSISEIHRHNLSDNVIYIIRGSAALLLDGELHQVQPGLRVVIPRKVSHGFRTGAEQLEFVSIQIPPILAQQQGVFDRDIVG